jgi:hypothetical protein
MTGKKNLFIPDPDGVDPGSIPFETPYILAMRCRLSDLVLSGLIMYRPIRLLWR